jgi:hypothetical protein
MGARVRYQAGSASARAKPPHAARFFGPALASGDEASPPSPVQDLQLALEAEFGPAELRKWPPIATLGFIVGVCGGFWGLVAVTVLRVI